MNIIYCKFLICVCIIISVIYAEKDCICQKFLILPNENNFNKCSSFFKQAKENEIDSTIEIITQTGSLLDAIDNQNQFAVKLSYEIMRFMRVNPEYLEYLDIHIGALIIKNPEFFLQTLSEYYIDSTYHNFINLSSLVGNLGDEYVDKFNLQYKQVKKRIYSMEQVKSTKLNNIKMIVLNQLKKKKLVLEELIK